MLLVSETTCPLRSLDTLHVLSCSTARPLLLFGGRECSIYGIKCLGSTTYVQLCDFISDKAAVPRPLRWSRGASQIVNVISDSAGWEGDDFSTHHVFVLWRWVSDDAIHEVAHLMVSVTMVLKDTQDDLTGGEDESSIPLLSVDEMADDKSPLLPSRDVFIGSGSESSSVQFGGQEKVPWWSYIWDYDPERTKEERRFLQKLDVSLLTILSLGYFIKNLDQTNISNAYVSGMKEALQMNANELNMIDVAWTTGYVIGQLPSQFILTKVRPSIWIPSCELVWTVLTFSLAAASSSKQVIAIRFLVGLVESIFYPAAHFLIGSWYKPSELGKRACIFHASSAAAGMFSGYLQAAVYKGMNGTLGKEGWQWLFIMDGLISLPICLVGFFLIPDLPENTRAFYLTDNDAERARKRMRDVGRAPRKELGWSILKRTFARWHVYGLTLLYVVFINTGPSGSVAPLALWLKSRGFPVSLVNIIPTGQSAVQLVTTIGFAILSDFLRNRPLVMGISASFGFLSYLLLSIWNIPTTLKYIAYFIGRGAVAFGPLAMSWANEICGPDAEERAIVLGVMNASGYAVNTWLPVLTYPVKDAPRFKKGFRFSAVAIVGQVVVMGGVWALKRREDRRRRRRGPRSRVEGSGFVRLED